MPLALWATELRNAESRRDGTSRPCAFPFEHALLGLISSSYDHINAVWRPKGKTDCPRPVRQTPGTCDSPHVATRLLLLDSRLHGNGKGLGVHGLHLIAFLDVRKQCGVLHFQVNCVALWTSQ